MLASCFAWFHAIDLGDASHNSLIGYRRDSVLGGSLALL